MPMDKYDAGDDKQVKQKKSAAQLKDEARHHYLTTTLSTYEGRATLWEILSLCGIYKSSFTGDERTYFYEGKRRIGLDLIEKIEAADPHSMARIRDEAIQRDIDGR